MKFLIFSLALLVSGCSMFKQPVPIAPQWPDAPAELKKKCETLKTIASDKVNITDMMRVIVENYMLHYECSAKVDGWNQWYDSQKKIYETVVPDKKSKPWYDVWSK